MKIIKTVALAALLAVAGFAQETLPTNMVQSESGLSNIQKGFLYNNLDLIKKGAEQLKDANSIFHNQEETKKYLPQDKAHMSNIAFNAANRIEGSINEMLSYIEANQMNKAQNSYANIMNACGACHAVVRGW